MGTQPTNHPRNQSRQHHHIPMASESTSCSSSVSTLESMHGYGESWFENLNKKCTTTAAVGSISSNPCGRTGSTSRGVSLPEPLFQGRKPFSKRWDIHVNRSCSLV